jgi:hypothetical protein
MLKQQISLLCMKLIFRFLSHYIIYSVPSLPSSVACLIKINIRQKFKLNFSEKYLAFDGVPVSGLDSYSIMPPCPRFKYNRTSSISKSDH